LKLKNGENSKQQSSNNHNNGGAKTGAKTGGYRSQVTMLTLIQIDHSQKRANDVDQEERITRTDNDVDEEQQITRETPVGTATHRQRTPPPDDNVFPLGKGGL
jgi:hypothetical protein